MTYHNESDSRHPVASEPSSELSTPSTELTLSTASKEKAKQSAWERRTVSRRSFVFGIGATLVAAPFVKLFSPRSARAATSSAKRLVVVFNPNGTVPGKWRPSGADASFSFPSGSILEPLAPLKDKLVVIDGLQFTNASNHEGGMVAMLTGNGRASDESKGMSIDQFVASFIGGSTRLRSLELGVQSSAWGAGPQTRMSYSAAGVFAPPDDDPRSVYRRIFGDSSQTTPATPQKDAALQRQKSVLDAVKGDLTVLKARIGSEEQRKLDQHLTSIRELERSLGIGSEATCSGGSPPAAINLNNNVNMPAIGKAQMDLMVAALACGATNVASLQWAFTVAPHVLSWLGLSDSHHNLSHCGDADAVGVGNFVKAERWFAEQFGYLIEKLATTSDPGGGTLLDSTLVLWAKEMGDSRLHVSTDVPMVVAGGGVFKPGRYLKTNGASHVHLHVSICQAMGLANNTFGNLNFGTGPLAGL